MAASIRAEAAGLAADKADQRRIIAGTPERSNQRLWVSLGGGGVSSTQDLDPAPQNRPPKNEAVSSSKFPARLCKACCVHGTAVNEPHKGRLARTRLPPAYTALPVRRASASETTVEGLLLEPQETMV
jgi:hypothetical protein